MKIFLIGYGQGGGKIADLFLEYDRKSRHNCIVRAVAINSAKSDLLGLNNIPMEDRILIGESIVKGHGVGADNEMGARIAAEDIYSIQSAIDRRGTHEVDAFLIIAGLGGGTGSGGAPVIARRLKKVYAEPVYGLGILPAKDEGGLYSLNAARSLMTFVKEVDNLFIFDNEPWKKEGSTLEDAYGFMNNEIVRRFGILFGAGESEEIGQVVVDAAEIINTLRGGGISTVGYAVEEVGKANKSGGGLLKRLKKKEKSSLEALDTTTKITSLTRRAVMGRLTLPCDIASAERGLLVIAGPTEALSRKGIEKAKLWVEEMIRGTEVRGGDYPVARSNYIAAVTVFSGVTDVPRIRELQEMATEAQKNIQEFDETKEEKHESLWHDDIKPLF
ncbi:MAG: tubulin/FtsZ family protein [Candidatus Syntrophoarchaeum sp.]|nr:tubulin/FtsZ family protein [Candidatus Syntrophoarchaeum sp.]